MSLWNKKKESEPEDNLSGVIQEKFLRLFQKKPLLVRSPGRVNLIGEHTDYNEGFVLPAAVDKEIYFALFPRNDQTCSLYAHDLNEHFDFELNSIVQSKKRWPNYLMGVVDQLQKSGYALRGFNCVFGGNIPLGAGMSSSAAIEAGLAFALNDIFDLHLEKLELVKLSQRAENEFVGVRCGIMDQFINIFGKEKKVLKLDCRSLDYAYYPFEREDLCIVLCDTLVKRELASSEYNVRRQQCEAGVKILSKHNPSVKSLRDVSLELLESHRRDIDQVVYRRCKYVILENRRVEEACRDLETGDFRKFGQRMFASHDGLRYGYEVSCQELDILVEAASRLEGVLGARMMGAGFGGCTINLVEKQAVDNFIDVIGKNYQSATRSEPKIYVSMLRSGTEFIK